MRHLEAQLEEKNQELQRVCVVQTASVHFSFHLPVSCYIMYFSTQTYLIANVLFVAVMAASSYLTILIY